MQDIIFDILSLLCGLAIFLYGMDVMGDALKKSAGSQLKNLLEKMTSNPFKGFLLGLGVTAVIQSSSATTVMVVGFVNSGTMTLLQSVGVIMGANIGTTVTAWLTGLSGVEGASAGVSALKWLKPSAWMPILAIIGIVLLMTVKRGRKRDIAGVFLGFVVLMTGMDMMSAAVDGFASELQPILTLFQNPFLALLVGVAFTAIIQSSSASIGILQALTVASVAGVGGITFGAAIPLIVGINVGTCITAVLSAIGANINGKRSAFIQLYFNVIAGAIILGIFYIVSAFVPMPFLTESVDMWWIAIIHTLFNILSTLILGPFYKQLTRLTELTIRDKKEEISTVATRLDERLFETPSVAVGQATNIAYEMAEVSISSLKNSLRLFDEYTEKEAEAIRMSEERVDAYEDALGSYLVKLSSCDVNEADSEQITKLLHIIGDLERISDHSVNLVESAEEMKDKKIAFSKEATREIAIMRAALEEILGLAERAFINNDIATASLVEPLEEVIDDLREEIKLNHIKRLQKSECTIEHGFVLSDILTNFERVSDHCSNLASCVVEISEYDALNMHKYTNELKNDSDDFKISYKKYKEKYSL